MTLNFLLVVATMYIVNMGGIGQALLRYTLLLFANILLFLCYHILVAPFMLYLFYFFYVILDSKRSNNTSPEDGKELEPLNPTSPKGREERNPDDKEGLKRCVNESLCYSVTAVHTHTNLPSGFLIFSSLYC